MNIGQAGIDFNAKTGLLKVREIQADTSQIDEYIRLLSILDPSPHRTEHIQYLKQADARTGRLLSKVRQNVGKGRTRPEEKYTGFQSVGTEELMILTLKEILHAEAIEIPHAHESYWGNPQLIEIQGYYGINSVRNLALGRAMVVLHTAMKGMSDELMYLIGKNLSEDSKVSDVGRELYFLAVDRMTSDAGDTVLADLVVDLLVTREDPDRLITQDELRIFQKADFATRISILSFHTFEYKQIYAPYFFTFSDVVHEETGSGRLFHASGLDRLPIMEEIKKNLKKVEK